MRRPCQADPEAWYADDPADQAAAAKACRHCPVKAACLEAALVVEHGRGTTGRHGVWGGLLPAERTAVARRNGEKIRYRTAPSVACRSGHPFTPENTFYRSDGARQCRTCTRERRAARLAVAS